MSPITDRSKAKEGGFAQVRAALTAFEGDVTSATWDKYPPKHDEEGKLIPEKEFLEIQTENVVVTEVTEELSMPVTEWNFRENCSDYKGSFWVEKFLESADKFKVLIPDGLVGKRVSFRKVTLEAKNRDGSPKPEYNSTNYVIDGIKGASVPAPKIVSKTPTASTGASNPSEPVEVSPTQAEATKGVPDPMEAALKLAIGKTEAQFRTAIGLDPDFVGSPLLSLAKAGMVTQALVNEGRLVLVGKTYQKSQ